MVCVRDKPACLAPPFKPDVADASRNRREGVVPVNAKTLPLVVERKNLTQLLERQGIVIALRNFLRRQFRIRLHIGAALLGELREYRVNVAATAEHPADVRGAGSVILQVIPKDIRVLVENLAHRDSVHRVALILQPVLVERNEQGVSLGLPATGEFEAILALSSFLVSSKQHRRERIAVLHHERVPIRLVVDVFCELLFVLQRDRAAFTVIERDSQSPLDRIRLDGILHPACFAPVPAQGFVLRGFRPRLASLLVDVLAK